MTEPQNVYACIAAVSAEIAQTGISKDRNNASQGYKFRGIDDVYNALAPMLAKNKLVIIPRILSRECIERTNKNGGALFSVTVEAEFDFVSAVDGSKHTARTFGEAMDSGDKATNKAMSAAYKYAAFQAFCIPTEGDNDADGHTHEPAARETRSEPVAQPRTHPTQRQASRPAAPALSGGGVRVIDCKIGKTGSNAKGQWTLYVVKFTDGREGTTFSKSIYSAALRLMESGDSVEVNIDGKNIVSLEPVFQQQEQPEELEAAPF
jgi:hypothetical protein